MKYFTSLLCILILSACSSETALEKHKEKTGKELFQKNCVICHGSDGKLGFNGAKDLSKSVLTQEERIIQITNGKNLMSPFKGILTEKEIRAVAEFTESLKTSN